MATTYGGFSGYTTSGYMWSGTGTTYTLYNASGAPMTLPAPTPKPPPVKAPVVSGEWGWQVGRGSQGYARPPGYTGRHGKHPGYQPKGFRRMDRLAQIMKTLAEVRT